MLRAMSCDSDIRMVRRRLPDCGVLTPDAVGTEGVPRSRRIEQTPIYRTTCRVVGMRLPKLVAEMTFVR